MLAEAAKAGVASGRAPTFAKICCDLSTISPGEENIIWTMVESRAALKCPLSIIYTLIMIKHSASGDQSISLIFNRPAEINFVT